MIRRAHVARGVMTQTQKQLNRDELYVAQKELWRLAGCDHIWAPSSGFCWFCGADMMSDYDWIKELVTGCRQCHRSYVE